MSLKEVITDSRYLRRRATKKEKKIMGDPLYLILYLFTHLSKIK